MKPATWVQFGSFLLFSGLLYVAAFPLPPAVPVNAFLRLDPVVLLTTWLGERVFIPAYGAALLVVVLTALLGRFFCGWICPLGATIDFTDRWLAAAVSSPSRWNCWRPVKHQVLVIVATSALMGVSLAFLVAPLAVATRFFALLVNALVGAAAATTLDLIRPLATELDWTFIAYADPPAPRFAWPWFTAGLTGAILAAGRLAPRFWCRYLCPAGAILALAGHRPLWRRTVSTDCIDCGRCQPRCPTGAIGPDPRDTQHSECIACQACVRTCPTNAVDFGWRPPTRPAPAAPALPHRRRILSAAAGGAGAALVCMTDPLWPGRRGPVLAAGAVGIIRPPGAMPEIAFRNRCIGCGACMKACPTNTLQPAGLAAGWTALMSPQAMPRLGPCEPRCNACGHVCPTGAIRPLTADEKIWAKMGTAFILRRKCLAWEFGRPCLVCDEVCPYDAVHLGHADGQPVAVPFVDEKRCSGCGLCHHHCPVHPASAIVVEPVGALRLAAGSFRQAARRSGLTLELNRPATDSPSAARPTDGLTKGGLPPGFTP